VTIQKCYINCRDSRKSRQKLAKNTAEFCENRKNHGKPRQKHDIKSRAQRPLYSL